MINTNINDSIELGSLARREAKPTTSFRSSRGAETVVDNAKAELQKDQENHAGTGFQRVELIGSREHPWFKQAGIRPDPAVLAETAGLKVTEADNVPCDLIRPLADVNGDDYTLTEYQHHALASARYPEQGKLNGLIYTVLALCGEAGELANKLKKVIRDGGPVNEEVLADELSDVLWYVAAASRELNRNLGDLAIFNIEKLRDRAADAKKKADMKAFWDQLVDDAQLNPCVGLVQTTHFPSEMLNTPLPPATLPASTVVHGLSAEPSLKEPPIDRVLGHYKP